MNDPFSKPSYPGVYSEEEVDIYIQIDEIDEKIDALLERKEELRERLSDFEVDRYQGVK